MNTGRPDEFDVLAFGLGMTCGMVIGGMLTLGVYL